MSATGMVCQNPTCGQPTSVPWTLCQACQSAKDQLKTSSANKHKGSAVATWQIETQDGKVENISLPYFKQNATAIAELISGDSGSHIDSTQESHPGLQYTVENLNKTCSLDFQGCRKGGNTYWLDYQGQAGGGGSQRKTYFQVMIQCGAGVPTVDTIKLAITKSLGNALRSVIYKNTTDRPK